MPWTVRCFLTWQSSIDGWVWREFKALSVTWFDGLARILSRVEDVGVWPDEYIAMTMTMTMTHSEKSHIRRMKAWPYRQECGGHDPTKKESVLLIGKVCKYKLLRTEYNASSLEMNSKYK